MKLRIGYGYLRGDKEFHGKGCDRVLIDVDRKRECLADILSGALRLDPGDVIVVKSESDLGKGPALKRVREYLAAQSVTIEAFGTPDKPTVATQGRGIPYDALVVAQPFWHLPGMTIDGINEQLRVKGERQGKTWGPYKRHQFIYALGNQGDAPRVLTKPENEWETEMSHALERTSPKGGPFIGRCTKCGKPDLPMSAVQKPCPADDITSDEQALLDAIK